MTVGVAIIRDEVQGLATSVQSRCLWIRPMQLFSLYYRSQLSSYVISEACEFLPLFVGISILTVLPCHGGLQTPFTKTTGSSDELNPRRVKRESGRGMIVALVDHRLPGSARDKPLFKKEVSDIQSTIVVTRRLDHLEKGFFFVVSLVEGT
jgi:hypothetical protein